MTNRPPRSAPLVILCAALAAAACGDRNPPPPPEDPVLPMADSPAFRPPAYNPSEPHPPGGVGPELGVDTLAPEPRDEEAAD
jgi:hypothetical protein